MLTLFDHLSATIVAMLLMLTFAAHSARNTQANIEAMRFYASRTQGKAVVVCTHRLDEAERLCDRFGLLHRGQMMLEGTLPQLQAATGLTTLTEMFLQGLASHGAQGASAA